MGDIVKYHNDMNNISFNGFNEKELNILFSLIVLARDKGSVELTIPFSKLKELSNDDGKNKKRFINSITNVNSKIIQLFYKKETENSIIMFTLFNKFVLDLKKEILFIKINDDFAFLLNDLVKKFTMFELVDFVKLKSSYSKHMFRLLKQWEGTKYEKKEKIFEIDELKKLLGAPIGYDTYKFNQKVIKQLENDLPKFFPEFKVTREKEARVIKRYKFTWKRKIKNIHSPVDLEIEITEDLNKAFEKASHNRYIKPFLTEDNKAILIEAFDDEKILVKGLLFAYKSIDREFTKLSYLIKTIKTGIEQQKTIIKVVKKEKKDSLNEDDYIQTTFDDIITQPKEKEKDLKEIYEDDFENLYKEYLKDNNANDTPYTRKCFSMPYKIIKRENKK